MYRVTQWGEYGVHVVLYLAKQQGSSRSVVGASEISESQNIALNYTQQILLRLKSVGVVDSVRGPKGGYFLTRDPSTISIHEILVATEGDTISIICDTDKIDHDKCKDASSCSLRSLWYGLKETINDYLCRVKVSDLLEYEINASQGLIVNLPVANQV